MAYSTYNYHVRSLLAEAHLPHHPRHVRPAGPGREIDHVVELQLVVAALNRLPYGTFRHDGWQRKLLDNFVEPVNLQYLSDADNEKKGEVVGKLIRGERIQASERHWIDMIRPKWLQIRQTMRGFQQFKENLDSILGV